MSGTPLLSHGNPIALLEARVAEREQSAATAMSLVRIAIDEHTRRCESLWEARRDLADAHSRLVTVNVEVGA